MLNREAACSCGQLRLTCQAEPVLVSMCHCLDCQRRTGSTFGVQAFYPKEQVLPAKGVAKKFSRQADSGRIVTFNFCPECGSTVFWVAEQRPDLIAIAVGMFADPDFNKPRRSLWERRRHSWTMTIDKEKIEHSD